MNKIRSAFASLLLLFITGITAFAQDGGGSSSSSTTTSTTTSSNNAVDSGWLASNWMWLAGAGVLLLILIIALASRGSRSTTVERTTVIRDNNP